MVDIIQDEINAEPETEPQADLTPPDDGTIETQLTQEISTLWSDQVRLSASRRMSSKELRQIRATLAERLHAMKPLLCRPDLGPASQWRDWLRQRGIPRSTADRLVARHAETLGAHSERLPSEQGSEPARKGVGAKVAEAVWPKLQAVLNADASVVEFIATIAKLSGAAHEWRSRGLMIFKPAPKAASESPHSAPAPDNDQASQPSDDGNASSEESAAETATATPAMEQVAGDGDNCAGAVA